MERSFIAELADRIRKAAPEEAAEIMSQLRAGDENEILELLYDWKKWARPGQIAPQIDVKGKTWPTDKDWRNWILLAGRGYGKTRTGGEQTRAWAESGDFKRIGMIGSTAAAVRDVMVLGPGGLMDCCPPWNMPTYKESRNLIIWENPNYPSYKARCHTYSAEKPEGLRGPQHEKLWSDELLAWKYPQEAFDMAMLGLRLGRSPQNIITTTPKPLDILINKKTGLLYQETTALTIGKTYDNADNLAAAFFEDIVTKFEGSRLGRQELLAEVLEDMPGALWTRQNIEDNRIPYTKHKLLPVMLKVVVAVDPAGETSKDSADTAISVTGFGDNGHFYVFEIVAMKEHPDVWGRKVLELYDEWSADEIVVETNYGGLMATQVLTQHRPYAPIIEVKATLGKRLRAEPVALLYERNLVHHTATFGPAEDQMVNFNPLENPTGLKDMVDALVWGMTRLIEFAQPGSSQNRIKVLGERTPLSQYANVISRFA